MTDARQRLLLVVGTCVLAITLIGGAVRYSKHLTEQDRVRRLEAARAIIFGPEPEPFAYQQVCFQIPQPGHFQLDGISLDFHQVYSTRFEKIREQRDLAIEAIAEDLRGYLRMPTPPKPDGSEYHGQFLLNVIVDLNAVELMPLLLSLEEEFRPGYLAIESDETEATWDARLKYTHLVSTIATLLRAERWQPLMETELGKTANPGESAPFGYPSWMLDAAWRDRIVGWARDYLRANPKPIGTAGMSPKSRTR